MIKLENIDDEPIFYVDIVNYYTAHNGLSEELLNQDDVIQHNRRYHDPLETRKCLLDYLKPIAVKIKDQYSFIDDCEASSSPDRIKHSLSNYIDVYFKHPDEVDETTVKKLYTYTIRFPDHENMHPEYRIQTQNK